MLCSASSPVASTTEKALKLKYFRAFYLFVSILQLGQHKKNFLHLPCEKVQYIQEIEKLSLWIRTMYALLLTTGIRRSECFGLQWQGVDFINKSIHIERSVTHTSMSGIVIGLPDMLPHDLRHIPAHPCSCKVARI